MRDKFRITVAYMRNVMDEYESDNMEDAACNLADTVTVEAIS